ncbi:hypothetical protein O7630_33035 [Micromonospora sp. WMMD718]|uniref:hypothetical protein n=1 Tax=unclassified Micromonospora TaxID=2617518 RepID=UPI00064BEB3F|nr:MULTISPECIES: hypothetical protein [unclassified Micromonospora]MDG4755773.1 hypothetical protein [Micromonospora sp. WMMD718]
MSSPHTYAIGDRVTIDPAVARASTRGVTYRVTRLLPVNVVVEPVDGGRPVKVNPTYLRPAPAADTTTSGSSTGGGTHSGEWTMIHEAPLHPGTLVTVAGPGWKQPPGELYVVLRDTGTGRVSLVPLGGNNGRYWRGVSCRLLTIVDPTRVRLDSEQTT